MGSYSYVFGPLMALGAIGLLVVLLRWAFSRGGSVVARPPRPGREGDYGLLVSIASPGSYVEGEMARQRLVEAGLRATLAQTVDGPRLMVFARDESRAREVLSPPR